MSSAYKTNANERKSFTSEDVEIISPEIAVNVAQGALGGDAIGNIEIQTDKTFKATDLETEKFMADMLEVQLMEAGDENENQWVEVKVNGLGYTARRGDCIAMRRSHVAVLAGAKDLRLKQIKVVAEDGSMGYQERMVAKLVYPFSIVHDPAGRKGADWLRQLLQNRA